VNDFARRHLQLSSSHAETRYNRNATSHQLEPGDLVPTRTKGRSLKLQRNWDGPYEIIKKLNDVVYRIRHVNNHKPQTVHFDRLAPYHTK
ncbi:unnamed protein product, partial [Ixodes persulcatus]